MLMHYNSGLQRTIARPFGVFDQYLFSPPAKSYSVFDLYLFHYLKAHSVIDLHLQHVHHPNARTPKGRKSYPHPRPVLYCRRKDHLHHREEQGSLAPQKGAKDGPHPREEGELPVYPREEQGSPTPQMKQSGSTSFPVREVYNRFLVRTLRFSNRDSHASSGHVRHQGRLGSSYVTE